MPQGSQRSLVKEVSARDLMRVALGEAAADLAIVNGDVVNVYIGEVLSGNTILTRGDKIAYVGKNTPGAITSATRVIDASSRVGDAKRNPPPNSDGGFRSDGSGTGTHPAT